MNIQFFVNSKPNGLRQNIKPVKNIDFDLFPITDVETTNLRGKPMEGGIWTTDDGHTWIKHCLSYPLLLKIKSPAEETGWEMYKLTVKPGTKIYTIQSKEDYNYLKDKYLLENFLSFNYLDWEKISEDFDGVRITNQGLKETKGDLFGWEIPQTLWFRWVFEPPEKPTYVPIQK
ncbi:MULTISPECIES: hypothetical protein [Priestia]|uniref:hypothetical protein n=1 Tax=Priestia TaxID=2800373 RepID=UPI001C8D925B|nr:hypothetical protein [Priestia aryabhattai]MBY0213844.1 hypothetical protein [Priestia aryabhattai]